MPLTTDIRPSTSKNLPGSVHRRALRLDMQAASAISRLELEKMVVTEGDR